MPEGAGRTVSFGHVGLQVGDVDRLTEYYRDVIGLIEVERQLRNESVPPAAHLQRIARLKREQVIMESGAFLDTLSTSIMLIRATTAEEARQVAADDVYVSAGVWEEVRVRPFARVAR